MHFFLRAGLLTLALLTPPALNQSMANDASPADKASDHDADVRKDSGDGAPNASAVVSPEQICTTLAAAAQDNDLPLSFFSNLIWQESRFALRAMSPAGAVGIAQFMPKTAAMVGLHDPFDPRQALPASARLLHDLQQRYGNVGLAAAAYNAGEGRVNSWLHRGGVLPRETRNYVLTITGVPVEQWKGVDNGPQSFPLARKMPCRDHEAFAGETAITAAAAEAPAPELAAQKPRRQRSWSVRTASAKRLLKRGTKRSVIARAGSISKTQRKS